MKGALAAVALLATPAIPSDSPPLASAAVSEALAEITAARIEAAMRFLADDILEGRGTGSRGYAIAATFVAAEFEGMGLEPLGSSGGFLQEVPLRRARALEGQCSVTISGARSTQLAYGRDFVMSVDPLQPDAALSAPVVFVGYGVSAPEYGHDDYADVDARDAIVAAMDGGPAALPKDPRAYYGSFEQKRLAARRHGAVGLFLVTTPEDERDWSAVVERAHDGWMEPEGGRPWMEGEPSATPFLAAISPAGADILFEAGGRSWQDIVKGVRAGRHESLRLAVRVDVRQRSERLSAESPNVIALLRGSDAKLAGEYVVYTAHLDHLGIGQPVDGDSIYNGARDNASGSAGLLAVARAFTRLPRPPRRSVIFLATAAEEAGLDGAAYFVMHPPVEAHSMVANLNLDGLVAYWPLRDVAAWGAGRSTLRGAVERAAALLGLEATLPEDDDATLTVAGDQVCFAQAGIPVAWIVYGHESRDPAIDAEALEEKWGRAHQPSDDMTQPFDFDSARKLAQTAFLVGYETAQETDRPAWNAGDFFGDRHRQKLRPK
jgi:hypothetical protein